MENESFVFLVSCWVFLLYLTVREMDCLIEIIMLLMRFSSVSLSHCDTTGHYGTKVVTLIYYRFLRFLVFVIVLSFGIPITEQNCESITFTASTLASSWLPTWSTLVFIGSSWVHCSVTFFTLSFKDFNVFDSIFLTLNVFFLITILINVHDLMFLFHQLFLMDNFVELR